MYKQKLCLGAGSGLGHDIKEQIRIFHDAGFDGFFVCWDEHLEEYRALADELGMIFQSVHAPFNKSAKMWRGGEAAEEATAELLRAVDDCSHIGVPILVVHCYIGFEGTVDVTESGIECYRRVVDSARSKGVKIAFENTEGEEYLAALMNAFKDYDNVGFCWDTGHELCYNHNQDMLALYGDRLIATHINDNLGISRYDGKIFWTDDLHLLPFDGIHDWCDVVDRMNRCGYDGILTFELVKTSKPNRHDNDKYDKMSIEEYVTEAYARACRVAYLKTSRTENK